MNFGLHKDFHFGERVVASFGADFDNIFNHPIRMPNQDFGDGSFAYLGGFDVNIDPSTLIPAVQDVNLNADDSGRPFFGRAYSTFPQEGVDSRRTIRLRLRATF